MLDKNSGTAGAYIQTYTFDVHGDTLTQTDHYINIGESYITNPFIWSLEDSEFDKCVNPYLARLNRINITVLSQVDYTFLICLSWSIFAIKSLHTTQNLPYNWIYNLIARPNSSQPITMRKYS